MTTQPSAASGAPGEFATPAAASLPPQRMWPRSAAPRNSVETPPLAGGDPLLSSVQSSNVQSLQSRGRVCSSISTDRPNPRVFEVWSQLGGKNRFLCNGRCVTGPRIDLWYNCCAWSFILIPCIFYFTVIQYLWYVSKLLVILTILVMIATFVFLLLTSCTDPGIIPRHSLQLAVDGLEAEVADLTACPPLAVDTATGEPVCNLTEEQCAIGYRFCPSCKVIRPPRSSHCRDCDNCVMRFDHHCPFVNNCVGQRNYSFFTAFLISTGCLGVAVTAGIAIYFSENAQEHYKDSSEPWLYILIAIIGVPTAVLLIGVISLLTFHSVLACRGRTTKEVLGSAGRVNVGGRTLFTMRGPSLIHPRARVRYPMSVV